MNMIVLFCGWRLDNYDFGWINKEKIKICAVINSEFYNSTSKTSLEKCDDVIIVENYTSIGHIYESDFEEVTQKIDKVLLKYNINSIKVACCYEGDVSLSCKVREYFSSSGMGYNDSLLFRDKEKTKEFLNREGINVPKFIKIDVMKLIEDFNYFNSIEKHLALPFIIKPTSSGGGYGVYKITSYEDIVELKNQLTNDIHLNYEAEEFLVGDLYHCDIIIKNSNMVFSECSIYNHQYFGFEKHTVIGSAPLDDNNAEKTQIIDFCKIIIEKIGAFDGSYHCEVYKNADKITFLELGARPAGALIMQMYELMYGINFLDFNLAVQSGLDYPYSISRKYYAGWAAFCNYAPIKLKKIYSFTDGPEVDAKWHYEVGDCVNTHSLIGSILYKHKQCDLVQKVNSEMKKFHPFDGELL
jgi:hypothetical protein